VVIFVPNFFVKASRAAIFSLIIYVGHSCIAELSEFESSAENAIFINFCDFYEIKQLKMLSVQCILRQ